jgi:uncharacterized protein YhfF
MKKINSWKFGDTPKEANNLLDLVLSGKKKATSSLYEFYIRKKVALPYKGNKNIITDSKNIPRCLIITTKVEIKPFEKITAKFAAKEGEGDKSLHYWKKVHKKFFTKRLRKMNKEFSEDILVVCEEFKVIKVFQ